MQSPKQRQYRREATKTWNVKCGATRSGKTYGDYFLLPKRLMERSGQEGLNLILGNTEGTIRRNVIEPMQSLWGTSLVSSIRADSSVTMFGERVYCLGADNIRHVDRLRGMSVKYCYGDEVVTWQPDMFTMLQSRLDKPYSMADLTCNPEGPGHWFKRTFLDRGGPDLYVQSYQLDDNPFLSPAVRDRMKRDFAGTVLYDRYVLGRWVAAEGAVYRRFADAPERFTADKLTDELCRAVIGVDFGGGRSAHAFSCVGFSRGMRRLWVLEEYYEKRALDPEALCEAFVAFAKKCIARYPVADVWCDSAEQTLIGGLRLASARARLPLNIGNAAKRPINERIRGLCMLMGGERFTVLSHCTHTLSALRDAVWDAQSPVDKRLDDGSTNIDSLDALEYAFERDLPEMLQR